MSGRVARGLRIVAGHAFFDGTSWVLPGERLDELTHTLIYGAPTHTDAVAAASVIAAYCALIAKPERERNVIVATLREAMAVEMADTRLARGKAGR